MKYNNVGKMNADSTASSTQLTIIKNFLLKAKKNAAQLTEVVTFICAIRAMPFTIAHKSSSNAPTVMSTEELIPILMTSSIYYNNACHAPLL